MRFTSTSSRPQPAAPPDAFNTYTVRTPIQYLRDVDCRTARCPDYEHGWRTHLDVEHSPKAAELAEWIRHQSGRRYREGWTTTDADGTVNFIEGARPPGETAVFVFPPGQECFRPHTVNDGPIDLLVSRGDWRRSEPIRRHTRPADWVEDCAEAVDRFNQQRKKG